MEEEEELIVSTDTTVGSNSAPPPPPPISPPIESPLTQQNVHQQQQQFEQEESEEEIIAPPTNQQVFEQFELYKNQLFDYIRSKSKSLPLDYQSCTNRSLSFILDIEKSQLQQEVMVPYLLSVILYEINETLQLLHDVAEDRVIRGNSLSSEEIEYIKQITKLYYTFLDKVLPMCQLTTAADATTMNDWNNALVISQEKDLSTREEEEVMMMNMTQEQVNQFCEKFIKKSGEVVIKYGIVYKIKSNHQKKLKYLFLTNYQLLLCNSLQVIQTEIDLPLIKIIKSKSNTSVFQIVNGKKTIKLQCDSMAWEWIQSIQHTRELFMNMAKSLCIVENTNNNNNNHADQGTVTMEVIVWQAQELRQAPKKRPDVPYCLIGIGNPEHYLQDRLQRYKSKPSTRGSFESVGPICLPLDSSKEFCLDIRLYSQVSGGRNDFCYGMTSISLKSLLIKGENGEERKQMIKEWFDVKYNNETHGKILVQVKLVESKVANWIYDLKPPQVPTLCHGLHHIQLYEKIPIIYNYNSNKDIIGYVDYSSGIKIVDAATKQCIYSLEKSTNYDMFRKEYYIKSSLVNNQIIAKCFHKIKSIRKKKIRLFLMNQELLFSMEGGSFDQHSLLVLFKSSKYQHYYANEVLIKNGCGIPVASVVFGKSEQSEERSALIQILDSRVDGALLVAFALYVLKT